MTGSDHGYFILALCSFRGEENPHEEGRVET